MIVSDRSMREKRLYILYLFIWSMVLPSFGQKLSNRLSEEQVSEEGMLIEAKKKRLLGDSDAAREMLKVLLEKYRNNDVAAYELAEIYLLDEDYEEAARLANLAIGINPTNEWYQLLKAEIAKRQEDYILVADVYQTLYDQNPNRLEHLHSKGLFLAKANAFEDAIDVFTELEKQVGVTERTALLKFELWKKAEKPKKATQVLEELVGVFPRNMNYRHHLAVHLKRIGKSNQALEVYREILEIDPQDARANVAMAATYRKQGDQSNYLQAIRPIIENGDTDIDLKIAELMPYVREIQNGKADQSKVGPMLELLQILENTHNNDAKAYALHADVLSIIGDLDQAVEKYAKTLEVNPANFLVWEQYLGILADLGMLEKLQSESERAMDFFPNQANIYYLNGMANGELGNYQDAISSLQQAQLMVGKNMDLKVSIYAMLGHSYRALGQDVRAEKAFEDAMSLDASNSQLANDYAYHLAKTGSKLDEALKYAESAVSSNQGNPRYQATKAWVQYKLGQLEKARKTMEVALERGGDRFGYILENYGDILYRLKDVEGAVGQWKAAQGLGRSSKDLDKKITERRLEDAQ